MTNLEFQRRARELSQESLAKMILYSRSVISRLETQTLLSEDIHPRLRAALERFFGLPLEELLSSIEPKAQPTLPDRDAKRYDTDLSSS